MASPEALNLIWRAAYARLSGTRTGHRNRDRVHAHAVSQRLPLAAFSMSGQD